MRSLRSLVLPLTLAIAAPALTRAQGTPADTSLVVQVTRADSALFTLFFQGCDPAALTTMVTRDLEFYHDKAGVVATNGAAFVADYEKQCTARRAPDAWRSRRELVAGSMRIDPVPGYGAISHGAHVFYERKGDGPERLAGRALFTMLWRYDQGRWQLSRVMSFAHEAAK